MTQREGNRDQIIEDLVEKVAEYILNMDDGTEASITDIVNKLYISQGYEFKHVDVHHGYVWTIDGGISFSLKEGDLFDVWDKVTDRLEGQCELDFSKYDNMVVGLPYNLDFTVKKIPTDANKRIVYAEPVDYFPEEIHKKYGLGEYAEESTAEEQPDATAPTGKFTDQERYRLKNAMLDWQNERDYRKRVLKDKNIDEQTRKAFKARIKEAERYIELIKRTLSE